MSEDLCRLCGKTSGLTSVFDEKHLCFKISSCFGVKIQSNDTITKNICKSCYFFTNSVYEFRLSSISHDIKLKAEYKASQLKNEIKVDTSSPISYPSREISQDAFLNTFNLANKNDVVLQKSEFHPSVVALKRKFPNIRIPKKCNELNLDPIVWVEVPPKLIKLNSDLGIWSVRSKQARGKQPLVLTRVRSDSTSTKESKDSASTSSDVSEKLQVKFNFNIKSSPTNSEQSSVKDKKKRKKYPDWSYSKKKKVKARSSPQKKASPEKVPKIKKPSVSKAPSDSATPSTSTATSGNHRSELKSLLESDVHFNETQSKRPSIGESSAPRNEEYGNLLISVGEEIQTFICQTCNKIFDTLALLNNHKKYSHKSSLRCTKCSKRFAIVESLVKHNLTHHPETVASPSASETNVQQTSQKNEQQTSKTSEIQVNDQQTNERQPSPPPIRKSVARKKTNGTVTPTRTSLSSPSPIPDILEYVISSDDDVEITDVIEKDTTSSDSTSNNVASKESSRIDNIITAALEPQKSSNSDKIAKDCPVLFGNPVQQLIFEQNNPKKTVESEQPIEPPTVVETNTIDDDIFLIDDSDDEGTNYNKAKISNEEPFLIEDDNSSSSSLQIRQSRGFSNSVITPIVDRFSRPQRKESSDSCPSTSTDAETNPRQKIVVVPSAEDKEHMDAASSSSVKAKITNELSYVNYIFNKCSYFDKPGKTEKRWLLKDIHKFTEKTYLPVQIGNLANDEMTVQYGPVELNRLEQRQAFWESVDAIDIGYSYASSKTYTTYQNKKINVSKSVESAVKTNCIGPTSKNSLLKTNLQTTPKKQSDTKVPNTVTTVAKVGPTQMVHSPVNLTNSTAQNSPSFPSPIYTVSNQQLSPVSGTIQNVTSSPNVTFPNNQVTPSSVSMSPPVLQNYNQQTSKLINIALQNAASNYIQQNNQIRSYNQSKLYSTIATKPVLPVSPNRAPTNHESVDKTVDIQQTATNGYILVGVSAAQTNNGINEDSNGVPQQPIVINGMSYPSFTKTLSTTQPTFMVQQFAPSQNCVNICQKSVTTVTEQFAAVPFMVQNQPHVSIATIAQSMPSTTLVQSNLPTTQMVPLNLPTTQMVPSNLATTQMVPSNLATTQMVPSNLSTAPLVQSNFQNTQMVQINATTFESVECANQNAETVNPNSCDSTTRPSIRIKNLSELRGDNLNINQRNELHNLYSSAITNYVQNHSTSGNNRGTTDEYLQIS